MPLFYHCSAPSSEGLAVAGCGNRNDCQISKCEGQVRFALDVLGDKIYVVDTLSARVTWLVQRARRVLRTGRLAMDDKDYSSAINRAYYAVFYAANAALSTLGLERSKHSGVISEFRAQFVKTGLIEATYSQFYGDTMDACQSSDYDFMLEPGVEQAAAALAESE